MDRGIRMHNRLYTGASTQIPEETPKARTKSHLILMNRKRLLPEYQPLLSPDPASECVLLEADRTLTDDAWHGDPFRGAFRESADVWCATNTRVRTSIGRSRARSRRKRHGRAGG